MRSDQSPLGILLISGGHERAHYALVLATTAAALGRKVTLFATNAGLHLFLRTAPLHADPREAVLRARGVGTLAELYDAAHELGVACIVCEAGLRSENIAADALDPRVTTAGAATFLAATGNGSIVTL